MPSLSLHQTQALADLAARLYEFLPGSSAWKAFTWRDAAVEHGLVQFWDGGSKLPAITRLLEQTLQHRPDAFSGLLVTAVREGVKYRLKKNNPMTRENMEGLNQTIARVGFKIPELHDAQFLGSLPSEPAAPPSPPAPAQPDPSVKQQADRSETLRQLRERFLALNAETNAQKRGYAFERLLTDLFALDGLAPRGSFRVAGEQIDGSFDWQGWTVLVEARWRSSPADAADLYVLRGKVEGKSAWTRGLFISINGFSDLAADTFTRGRATNLITMDGADLYLVLDERWALAEAIRAKLRHAGETGEILFPLAKAAAG